MAVQQLVDYIKKQLARGVRTDALKKVLLKEGWQSSDVDSSLKEAGASGINPPKKNMRTAMIIGGVALFLIIAALLAFYGYKRYSGVVLPEQNGQEAGAPAVEMVKEAIVKKLAIVPAGFDADVTKMGFNSDGSKVGFIAQDTREKKYFVFLNESKSGPYDEAYYPAFSGDGSKFAYAAQNNGKEFVVVDGVEGKQYDRIGTAEGYNKNIAIDETGSKIAYVAERSGKYFVVVNGKEGKEYDYISNLRILSGQRVNYRAKLGDKELFITDEGVQTRTETTQLTNPFGGKSTAKLLKVGDKQVAVINGKESRPYDSLLVNSGRTFLFSRDDQKVAYIAKDMDNEFAVVNNIEGKPYKGVSNLVFSPDSKMLAYVSTTSGLGQRVVVDEKEIGNYYEFIKYLAFSPDNKPVYIGVTTGQFSVVYDGKQGGVYEYVGIPFFGSDGKPLFGVKAGNQLNLVTW
jgi:hypothetical protein